MQASKIILNSTNGANIQSTMKSNNNTTSSIATTLNNIQANPLQQQLLQQQAMSIASQQNISIAAQQPQQIARTSTTLQIPPDCMVIKNEQGQLMLVPTNNNVTRNPLICNSILPLQQSVTSPQRNLTSLVQNNIIGSISSISSSVLSTNSRPILIQNQSIQQPQQQQRFTILPNQQQINRLLPNQSTTTSSVTVVTTKPSTNTNSEQITDQKEIIENVKKCKNFLSTLLKLASNQPSATLDRVMNLIQGLIDDVVTPEEFTSQLQQLLKSSPQPYLIPFLRKSLPYLRKFMVKNKSMTIDGIKPPTNLSNNSININIDAAVISTQNVNITSKSNTNINNSSILNTNSNIVQSNKVSINPTLQNSLIRPNISQQQTVTNQQQQILQQQLQQQLKNTTKLSFSNSSTTSLTESQLNTVTSTANNTNDNTLVNIVASSGATNIEALAALHTSKNFIAPTIPLPSSLPRLILSSNSTLLTSLQNQGPGNNVTTFSKVTSINTFNKSNAIITSNSNNLVNNKLVGINNALMQQQSKNAINKMPSMLLKNSNSSTDIQGEKRKFDSIRDDNDDINDVAAMGGVNLSEETKNFSNPVLIAGQSFGQTRTFNDEIPAWESQLLQTIINRIAQKKGLTHVHPDCVKLLSHAVKYKLTVILEQLSVISEHRSEIYKNEPKMEVTSEVKRQLKFRQELAKLEDDKAKEVKNLALMKAAKSRTKTDDPDQLKRKELAKKQQQEDMDAKRKEQSDQTALAAIGSKKKLNLSQKLSLMNGHHTNHSLSSQGNISLFNISGLSHAGQILSQRSRRANLKDLIHILQQDPQYNRSSVLYRAFIKY